MANHDPPLFYHPPPNHTLYSAAGAARSLEVLHGRIYDAIDVQWPQWFVGYDYGEGSERSDGDDEREGSLGGGGGRDGDDGGGGGEGGVPRCALGWSNDVTPVDFYNRYKV